MTLRCTAGLEICQTFHFDRQRSSSMACTELRFLWGILPCLFLHHNFEGAWEQLCDPKKMPFKTLIPIVCKDQSESPSLCPMRYRGSRASRQHSCRGSATAH